MVTHGIGRNTVALLVVWALSQGMACDDSPRSTAESMDSEASTPAPADAELRGRTDAQPLESDMALAEDAGRPIADAVPPIEDPPAAVRLNEIECRGEEWVELYFGGPGATDLTGWTLSDENDDPDRTYTIGPVTIQPGTTWVTADELPFKIGCGDDEIRLRSPSGRIVDTAVVGEPAPRLAWGRLPDGEGVWGPTAPTPRLGAPRAA